MKRPMLVAAVALIHGELSVSDCLSSVFRLIFVIILIIVLAYNMVRRKFSLTLVYAVFFITGFFMLNGITAGKIETKKIPDGEVLSFYAKVDDIRESDYNVTVIFNAEYKNKQMQICGVTKENIKSQIGNTVYVKAKKTSFNKSSSPLMFDEEDYYFSKKILMKVNIESVEVIDDRTNEFKVLLNKIRKRLCTSLDDICSKKDAGIIKALLFGDKSDVDEDTKEVYTKGGIIHILTISGLHISIMGMGVYKVLRLVLMPKSAGIISVGFMILYGIMTGGQVSTQRAIIMFLINIICTIIGREYDMANAICISLVVLLLANPCHLYNTGFLLSFLAVAAISSVMPFMVEFAGIKSKMAKSIMTSQIIHLMNAPVLSNVYGKIATYAIVVNILVLPLMTALISMSAVGTILGLISIKSGKAVMLIPSGILKFFEVICSITDKIPYSGIISGNYSTLQIIIHYVVVFIFTYLIYYYLSHLKDKEKKKYIIRRIIISVFIIGLNISIFTTFKMDESISFIDVGQGECQLYVSENNTTVLTDCGSVTKDKVGKDVILPYLYYNGIKTVDYMIITHSDSDHISGAKEIINDNAVSVSKIIIPVNDDGFGEIINLALEKNIPVIRAKAGLAIDDGSMVLNVLNPLENDNADINENSIVALIKSSKYKILLTGDIGAQTEEKMIKQGMIDSVDILKAAHHGSKYSNSSDFLKLTNPKVCVVSCGEKNSYGHPHAEAISRIQSAGSRIFITKDSGTIFIKLEDEGIKISTFGTQ